MARRPFTQRSRASLEGHCLEELLAPSSLKPHGIPAMMNRSRTTQGSPARSQNFLATARVAIFSGILFLSGIGALIFETLWLRLSGLAFGNSVWAAALILSSFMAGLALKRDRRIIRNSAMAAPSSLRCTGGVRGSVWLHNRIWSSAAWRFAA